MQPFTSFYHPGRDDNPSFLEPLVITGRWRKHSQKSHRRHPAISSYAVFINPMQYSKFAVLINPCSPDQSMQYSSIHAVRINPCRPRYSMQSLSIHAVLVNPCSPYQSELIFSARVGGIDCEGRQLLVYTATETLGDALIGHAILVSCAKQAI